MIHQRLPADKLLRLDPNQSLDIEQVSAIIDLLGSQRIEYLEEPFSNVDDCKKIKAAYPNISIALDESLWDVEPKNIPDFCDVIIMKPTRFHSLHSIKDFIGQAKKDRGPEFLLRIGKMLEDVSKDLLIFFTFLRHGFWVLRMD